MQAINIISIEFNTLLQQHTIALQRFAQHLTGNRNDADDLCQDTYFQAIKNQDKFARGTNFLSWLKTIMRNLFINNYRRQKRYRAILAKQVDSPILSGKNSANTTEIKLNTKELQHLIDQVDERFRQPFMMYYAGYAYEEIADLLHVPLGTVKSRIFTARQYLKKGYELYFN